MENNYTTRAYYTLCVHELCVYNKSKQGADEKYASDNSGQQRAAYVQTKKLDTLHTAGT
jgi:hypothetical protein